MGVVYKARQISLNRLAALKMVRAGAFASPQELARFKAEAQAVAQLQHPNIVQIFEVGEVDGLPYFSLEFVEGGSLDKVIAGQPQPVRKAAALVETLARAIHYAHQHNIVHRDLKPANVLLMADGSPKITDFGLAKQLEGDSGQTRSGQVMGTPQYMAPEQAAGRTKEVGPAADIYSLGVILYEMLTGRPPFLAPSTMEILHQVMSVEPVAPRRLQAQVPCDLETICLKCLEKEIGRRYASAAALADDLKLFLAGEPIRARAVGTIERAWKWAKRRPAVAVMSTVTALAVVLGFSAVTWRWQLVEHALRQAEDARQSEMRQRQAAVNAQKAEAKQSYFNRIALADLEWERANVTRVTELLALCSPEFRGWEWYRLNRLCSSSQSVLKTGRCSTVSWHRDGRHLLTAGSSKAAIVWDTVTGAESLTLRGHKNSVVTASWSPDGRRLATGSYDKTAKIWDAASGRQVFSFESHTNAILSVSWSLDCKYLATGSEDGTVKIWDADKGCEKQMLRGHTRGVKTICWNPDGKRVATGSEDRSIKIWNILTGEQYLTLKDKKVWPIYYSLAWSRDGERLASASQLNAEVWRPPANEPVLTLDGHTEHVKSIDWSPDEKYLATGSLDRTARVWDVSKGENVLTLRGHTAGVESVAWNPNGKQLATASLDGTTRIWNVSSDQGIVSITSPYVHWLSWNPDGRRLATGSWTEKPEIRIWDAKTGALIRSINGLAPHLLGISNTSWLWNPESISWSPDGLRLAAGMPDKTVSIFTALTGSEDIKLKGHADHVYPVSWSSNGNRLATGSLDSTARIWDVSSGETAFVLKGHHKAVSSVAWSPDDKRLATASLDGSVKIWDSSTGIEIRTIRFGNAPSISARWSPAGDRLIVTSSSSVDGPKIVDAASGSELFTLKGHAGRINLASWSPGGKRLATAGKEDKTVKIWDAVTGQEVFSLRQFDNEIACISWSPDGHRLAVACYEVVHVKTRSGIKIFDTTPPEK